MSETEAYIKIFFEEVLELSLKLEESLLNYEDKKNEDTDTDIRRIFHTLKGDFATFDIEKYSNFFHLAEDKWILNNNKNEIIEEVLEKITEIKEFVKIAEKKGFENALMTDFSYLKSKKKEFDIKKENNIKNSFETKEDVKQDELFDFEDSNNSEYIKVFFEEVDEITEKLEDDLLDYEKNKNEELDNDIKRSFHTLKGDFATFNINKYSDFFHLAEDRWKDSYEKKDIINDVLDQLKDIKEFMVNASEIGIKKAVEKISDNFKKNSLFNLEESKAINTSNSKDKDNLTKTINTFKMKFYEEKSLKIKEIEQLFDFYGEIIEIEKINKGEYQVIVDIPNIEEVKGMLEVLLSGEGEFTVAKGRPIEKKKKIMSKNTTELQGIKIVRVETKILDNLLNTMSELIIKHSSLTMYKDYLPFEIGENYKELLDKINDITREFQKDIFAIRLVEIKLLFYQLRRIVRDISHELDKNVEFEIQGESTKLDKSILEKIAPPLKHMIKNSMDHGIESRGERLRKGKSSVGKIKIDAYQQNDEVIIEIFDDGIGLDAGEIHRKALEKKIIEAETELDKNEIYNLIFVPGFSTSDYVTEISGRGIGMNVVKNTIDELNGRIEIESEKDVFTLFKISIPATVSIINAFLIREDKDKYIIPVSNIVEILDSKSKNINIKDKLYFNEDEFHFINLKKNYNKNSDRKIILLIQTGHGVKAMGVDEILDSKDFIIRDMNILSGNLKRYSGVTILSDGEVALALNPRAL